VPPLETVSEASLILAASAWGETAREDKKLGHDIYTYFLLEAFAKGDRNNDGAVTASEAHDFAREQTYYFTQGRQRPHAESDILGVDPIVLAGAKTRLGRPELFAYSPRLENVEVQVDGAEKGKLPGGVSLEPGAHRLTLLASDGARLYDDDIELTPGERMDLAALVHPAASPFFLQVRGGAQVFVDSHTRNNLIAPVPLIGIEFGLPEKPFSFTDLRADIGVVLAEAMANSSKPTAA